MPPPTHAAILIRGDRENVKNFAGSRHSSAAVIEGVGPPRGAGLVGKVSTLRLYRGEVV